MVYSARTCLTPESEILICNHSFEFAEKCSILCTLKLQFENHKMDVVDLRIINSPTSMLGRRDFYLLMASSNPTSLVVSIAHP